MGGLGLHKFYSPSYFQLNFGWRVCGITWICFVNNTILRDKLVILSATHFVTKDVEFHWIFDVTYIRWTAFLWKNVCWFRERVAHIVMYARFDAQTVIYIDFNVDHEVKVYVLWTRILCFLYALSISSHIIQLINERHIRCDVLLLSFSNNFDLESYTFSVLKMTGGSGELIFTVFTFHGLSRQLIILIYPQTVKL